MRRRALITAGLGLASISLATTLAVGGLCPTMVVADETTPISVEETEPNAEDVTDDSKTDGPVVIVEPVSSELVKVESSTVSSGTVETSEVDVVSGGNQVDDEQKEDGPQTSETTPSSDDESSSDDVEPVPAGLVEDDSGLRYSNGDGTYLAGEWKDVEGERYYFGDDGYAVRWAQVIDGNHYYFNVAYQMETGWVTWNDDSTKSYFGSDGIALSGWQTLEGSRYYFNPDNSCRAARWETIVDGSRYYFDGDCRMVTGLVEWKADGTRSLFGSDGVAVSGWETVDGDTYFFSEETGRSLRWEQVIEGKRYYFDSKGRMTTGWVTWNADSTKSFFGQDGVALSGWQKLDGDKYYFDPEDGRSARWETIIEGKRYYFDADCRMVTGLVEWKADGRTSYFDSDGAAVSGWRTVKSDNYYFSDEDGRCLRWEQEIDGETYYFDTHGRMHKGPLVWNAGGCSLFDTEGHKVTAPGLIAFEGHMYLVGKGGYLLRWEQDYNGHTYYFDSEYRMHTGPIKWNATGKWSLFDENGHKVLEPGLTKYGSDTFLVGSDGYLLRWEQKVDGKTYYFGSDYKMVTGWVRWNADRKWSYFDPKTGAMLTGTQVIDGTTYKFDSNGRINDRYTSAQRRLISACKSTPYAGNGWCAAWVTNVFTNAGVGYFGGNANDMCRSWCRYSLTRLEPGMIIAVEVSPSPLGRYYGHIGIYVGDNKVMHNGSAGHIETWTLDHFVDVYGALDTPTCGWMGGIDLSK